jgi:hypothetical protein
MGRKCKVLTHIHQTPTYITQIYLSVYGYSGDSGQYTLRVETGVSELQSAVRGDLSVCRS